MTDAPAARPPLGANRLAGLLTGTGWRVEVSESDPSTNATAAARARDGAADGLVVATEHQTAGRGRLDRSWVTPARAALTFSLLLRPSVGAERWPWLPLLTGYAVREGLRSTGVVADLKWPNDVLVGERKICGILLERVETPDGPAAVAGVGINTSLAADELPVPGATSVLLETGEEPDRTALLAAVLAAFRRQYDAWVDGDPRLLAAYRDACTTLGRQVRVELPRDAPLVGIASGIDEQGRLLVEGPDGVVAVGAGDVVHVRPDPAGSV